MALGNVGIGQSRVKIGKILSQNEGWRLLVVLLLYVTLTQFYNYAIPFSKGPDELTHFLYAQFISEHGRLPITQTERQTTSTRAYLPPVYHIPVGLAMAAADKIFTDGLSSDDAPKLRTSWQPASQQLIDIVLPRATLIRSLDERFPWRGEYLAWMVGRWVSTLLSAGTIILTFMTARILVPQRPGLAWLAAALLAFNPMFLFISSVLNDDTMVGLLMACYLFLFVLFLRGQDVWWLYLGLGLFIGLAVTTKYNTGLAVLSTTLVLAWLRVERQWEWSAWGWRVGLLWGGMILTSSWWFIWNQLYFNQIADYGVIAGSLIPYVPDVDPTAHRILSFFSDNIPDPGLPSNGVVGNFWDWVRQIYATSWALPVFGVAPYTVYWPLLVLLAALTLLSGAGLYQIFKESDRFQKSWLIAFLLHILVVFPLPLLRFFATYRINDTAQGRHIFFPTAPVIAILLLTGGGYWFKKSSSKMVMGYAVGISLFLWAIFHGGYLERAYPPPLPVRASASPLFVVDRVVDVDFGQILELKGYQTEIDTKNNHLRIDLVWSTRQQMREDYRTEITLLDQQSQPRLYWLSQPANGRFPTRAWQPGDTVRDTLHIPWGELPSGRYTIQLRMLGWDDYLPSSAEDPLLLGAFEISDPPAIPTIALWQQGKLVNDETAKIFRYRSTIPLTLHLPQVAGVFLQGPDGQRRDPVSDLGYLYPFMVESDWPSGAYQLFLDNDSSGLQVQVENFDQRRDGWNFTPPPMMVTTNANFGGKIELLGYDLPTRRVEAGGGIPVVLYWRGLTQMREDYTISVQLLAANLVRRGGYDRYPRETYNTSFWVPGEVVDDGFAVPVDAAAPNGIYTIRLGWYQQQDNASSTLPLIRDEEPLVEDSVTLGPIKVGGPPPEVLSTEPLDPSATPAISVEFGEPPLIQLNRYQIGVQDETLALTLIWQSVAPTTVDWSTFVHLRNQAGEVIAQKDGPTGNGHYPTSLWDPPDIIADTLLIPLPTETPAGTYTLVVGVYDLRTGERLVLPNVPNREIVLRQLELPFR